MKTSTGCKWSCLLLLLNGIAHTHFMLTGVYDPNVQTIIHEMHTASFFMMGSRCTLWNFYYGFGMFLAIFLFFSSYFVWQMGVYADTQPLVARSLAWPFLLFQMAVALITYMYFFPGPILVSSFVLCIQTYVAFNLQRVQSKAM